MPTSTTESPPVTSHALGPKKSGKSDGGMPALPVVLGIVGLLAAGALTGLAGWRSRRAASDLSQ
ncbi:MAG: hypothetical protein H0W70_14480 [Actinobacteria bacterium]|nr:hypothetical protein [Actinomycetota bacterium]